VSVSHGESEERVRQPNPTEAKALERWAKRRVDGWKCGACGGRVCQHCKECASGRCREHSANCPSMILLRLMGKA
jgi:hypothetical protein